MDLAKEFFVAHCRHVIYWQKVAGYKPVVTLEGSLSSLRIFFISCKTLIASLYFEFFLQYELLHTPVPGYVGLLGYIYQGSINIGKFKQISISQILTSLQR